MDLQAKQTVSFRSRAAALRATADTYLNPELRKGILEIADQWEELGRRIESEAHHAAGAVREPHGNRVAGRNQPLPKAVKER
jgi:hypothetical protein